MKYKDEEWLRFHVETMGLPLNLIAGWFNVNPGTISYYADKYGINSTYDEGHPPVLEDEEEIARMYVDDGMDAYEIGQEKGVSTGAVYNALAREGIERRERYKFSDGEDNPEWAGGYEPDSEIQRFYSSPAWKKKRSEILDRDGYCTQCGSGENLEAHHMIPVKDGGEKLDNDNLMTVCKQCHNFLHNKVYLR